MQGVRAGRRNRFLKVERAGGHHAVGLGVLCPHLQVCKAPVHGCNLAPAQLQVRLCARNRAADGTKRFRGCRKKGTQPALHPSLQHTLLAQQAPGAPHAPR